MKNNEMMVPEITKEAIENLVYEIRGQKVMLDFELAGLYGYKTKAFNQQVKNNIDKFPTDFMFKISKEELTYLVKSKILTSQKSELFIGNNGGTRYLPYAFTEQGVYMLMTVLKGEIATKQSIALVKAFKEMKDYIVENNHLLMNTNNYIESRFSSYDRRFEKIENKLEVVMDNFIDPSQYKHFLILEGEKIEADVAYQSIYKLAKQSIYIIDNYIDIKTLQLLKVCDSNIIIILFTDNKAKNKLTTKFLEDFKNDTKFDLIVKKSNDRFHDRYIVLDYKTENEIIYHCGSSSKDSGKRITTIDRIDVIDLYDELIESILDNEVLSFD